MLPRNGTMTLAGVLVALPLFACSKPAPPQPAATSGKVAAAAPDSGASQIADSPLWRTSWVLEDLAGTPSLEGVQPTLEFPEPGKVAGMGSCNRFFGAVEVSGDTIVFKGMATTRMACGQDLGKQESAYLKALQEAQRFEMSGETLLVYSKDLEKPLRFKAKS